MRTFRLFAVVGFVAIIIGCGRNTEDDGGHEGKVTANLESGNDDCVGKLDDRTEGEHDVNDASDKKLDPVKFGDGSKIGDHNISVYDSIDGAKHYAVLRIIKKIAVDDVITVATVNIYENTAQLTMTADSLLELTVLTGTGRHYVSQSDFGFGNYIDIKIAGYSPWTGGTPAIIGAEDPRASFQNISSQLTTDFKGDIVAVNFKENRRIRISQKETAGIRLSTNYTNSIKTAKDSPYCLTGVSRWGNEFNIVCP